jgi:hypothetical protein
MVCDQCNNNEDIGLFLTEKKWDFIMQPICKVGLPKVKISSKCPGVLVLYGPKIFEGMGIMYIYYNQEISHLTTTYLYEGNTNTITGELIRVSLEQL